jgi:hypothetical protein
MNALKLRDEPGKEKAKQAEAPTSKPKTGQGVLMKF